MKADFDDSLDAKGQDLIDSGTVVFNDSTLSILGWISDTADVSRSGIIDTILAHGDVYKDSSIIVFNDSSQSIKQWFDDSIANGSAADSFGTKATITDLNLKLTSAVFYDSMLTIDSTYITNDKIGFEDIANLPEEFARIEALDDSSWDSLEVDKIGFIDPNGNNNIVLSVRQVDSSLIYVLDDDTLIIGTDTIGATVQYSLLVGQFATVFDTTLDAVSYKVNASYTDTSYGSGVRIPHIKFKTDSSNTQIVRLTTYITVPYDFKDFDTTGFTFQLNYATRGATSDTNTQKVNIKVTENGSTTLLVDSTFPGDAGLWDGFNIPKTSLERAGHVIQSQDNIVIDYDISVKGGADIGIGWIKLNYLKDPRKN